MRVKWTGSEWMDADTLGTVTPLVFNYEGGSVKYFVADGRVWPLQYQDGALEREDWLAHVASVEGE